MNNYLSRYVERDNWLKDPKNVKDHHKTIKALIKLGFKAKDAKKRVKHSLWQLLKDNEPK